MRQQLSPAERIALRSSPADDGSGCIRWGGWRNSKGYGPVHAVAYELVHGPLPDGHEIDHVRARGCRWRDCVNADHLEAVTHAENLARRPPVTHCPKGHEYTPENTKPRRGGLWRECRICSRESRRVAEAKARARRRAARAALAGPAVA